MRFVLLVITLLIPFALSISLGQTLSQSPLSISEAEQKLAQANAFVTSYMNDSAKLILTELMQELKKREQLDSPFGLKVQLAQGTAMEHDDQDTTAMELLIHVKEVSAKKELWETYSLSSLVLANLHENMGRSKQCLSNLRDARSTIAQYSQDSIYPTFAVRISSYHRVFRNNIDSAKFYAQEALRTAPKFKMHLEEAIGHLLMGMLLSKTEYLEAIDHFRKAGQLYLKIEDYKGYSFSNNGIANLYSRNGNYPLALAYNDTTIIAAEQAIALGNDRPTLLHRIYKFRGQIYQALNQSDSAYYYLQKGYEMEVAYVKAKENDRVIEIDARYNDEKKAQQIEEQAQQIQAERQKRNSLLVVSFVILSLMVTLVYYFLQLRKANQKNREQAEQLKSLDLAKSRFFANVSHELRTPLALMLGPISILLKGNHQTEKQTRLLQMARRSGKQLEQLINEILDLRKLETGKMKLELGSTELAIFFQRYFAQFESLAERKQIDFSFEIDLHKELIGKIDREKSRQILYNLLSNAFKFTPTNGQIKASISIEKDQLQLLVRDTGPGIHPDDLPHVFDRYFQTNRPDKPAEGGTGIGLALCKEYAQLFGGQIEVKSNLGEGTVFKVVFPITIVENVPVNISKITLPVKQQIKSNFKTPVALTKEQKPTILVVEDNPDLQDYIRLVLQDKYQVFTAENGRAALKWLQSNANCQLILSDLMMPIMDGYQLLEKLKTEDQIRHIPVVMLTARADARDKLKALRIGVDDYLLKPFEEEELLVRIDNLLRNQASRFLETNNDTKPKAKALLLSKPDQEWLASFEVYVQKNLASDIISVPMLADEFAMSVSTLLRQLKRLTGLTPGQYLQEIRLNAARQLLEKQSYRSIAEVATAVGYGDTRSFSRGFKKRFGRAPSKL